ncbi:MAG: SDR family NAD(P)-dependent oxidoreductase [Acetobacteraceae bacterium]|nr:SDR family NAD(P)-dependent oxidoreductase [Acetobacteraceae bacterium]
MAAFVATPPAPAYAASKAAVERWAVGIAHGTRAEGVLVSSIYPGFVHHESQERTVFPCLG